MIVQIKKDIKPDRWYKPGEVYEVRPALVGYKVIGERHKGETIYLKDCEPVPDEQNLRLQMICGEINSKSSNESKVS